MCLYGLAEVANNILGGATLICRETRGYDASAVIRKPWDTSDEISKISVQASLQVIQPGIYTTSHRFRAIHLVVKEVISNSFVEVGPEVTRPWKKQNNVE